MKQNQSHSRLQGLPQLLLLAFALSGLPASGEFEKWTNKEGRTVNMEFIRMVEKDGEKAAEFKMINGKLTTIKLSTLAEDDAKRLGVIPAAKEPEANEPARLTNSTAGVDSSIYGEAIRKLRAGQEISEAEKEKCHKAFLKYYADLETKHGTGDNTKFPEDDRTDYFITAVKMALIYPQQHGGWPTRSDLRYKVLSGLQKKLEKNDDLFLVFCTIFPALDTQHQDYAGQSMSRMMKEDPFLAKIAEKWIHELRLYSDHNIKYYDQFLKSSGMKPPTITNEEKD